MDNRSINQAGLALLKQCEGCRLQAYKDVRGILTIGYGQTADWITPDTLLTQEQADALLKQSLSALENSVTNAVTVSISDNQFSALVCFAYNVGITALLGSTLLRELNAGEYENAADQFLRWNKSGGVVYPGLTKRRELERELFMQED